MPEMKSHEPGTFCWTDLSTTDPIAAKKFYAEVFGWKTEDQQMPPGSSYAMALVNGKQVAAIASMMADQQKAGTPPHWNVYVSVKSVDEATQKATSLGGKTIAPPMDVMDVGRMAVIQDPSGASLSLWQAKKHIGAMLMREHGAICWNELSSRNVDAAGGFYSKLFGWQPQAKNMGDMKYTVFAQGKEQRAGMMGAPSQMPASVPSYWTPYFQVNDCNAAVKKAESLKAKAMVPPQDVPEVGRFAILQDPQGAVFGVLQPPK